MISLTQNKKPVDVNALEDFDLITLGCKIEDVVFEQSIESTRCAVNLYHNEECPSNSLLTCKLDSFRWPYSCFPLFFFH